MGEQTAISWTDSTFNPWWGCSEVKGDPACANCYARAFAKRTGLAWGDQAERRMFGDKHWNEPVRWNARCAKAGKRERVFVGSMCDVFEDRPELAEQRSRLWDLIEKCDHLEWLLLTKRPQNAAKMTPAAWKAGWPTNVWFGATAGTQRTLEARVPWVQAIPAAVRFLSCEPLLEELMFNPAWFNLTQRPIDWVIFGGESGPRARRCHYNWIRGAVIVPGPEPGSVAWTAVMRGASMMGTSVLRSMSGRPIVQYRQGMFVKQMGDFFTVDHDDVPKFLAHGANKAIKIDATTTRIVLGQRAGRDPSQWPEEIRIQQWPAVHLVRGEAEARGSNELG